MRNLISVKWCTTFLVIFSLGIFNLKSDTKIDLSNPGFEDGTTSWWISDKGMSIASPEAARNGVNGLRVTDKSETEGSSAMSTPIPAQPGKKYQLRFWAKSIEGEGLAVYLIFMDTQKNPLNTYEKKNEITLSLDKNAKEWKSYSIEGIAPENTAFVKVWIHSYTKSSVVADVDDLTLVQLDK